MLHFSTDREANSLFLLCKNRVFVAIGGFMQKDMELVESVAADLFRTGFFDVMHVYPNERNYFVMFKNSRNGAFTFITTFRKTRKIYTLESAYSLACLVYARSFEVFTPDYLL